MTERAVTGISHGEMPISGALGVPNPVNRRQMSRSKRQERLGRALWCIALLASASCASARAVKLTGPKRIVSGMAPPHPAEHETASECLSRINSALVVTTAAWPTFADPVPTTCDALGRALEPELTTRMSSVLARIRDDYLLAECKGAAPGMRRPRNAQLVAESTVSMTQRWSSRANREPAIAQRSGQFLYVATRGTLQALDLSRPSAPRVVGRAALDGEQTQLLVHGHRLLAIARVHGKAPQTSCEPGTACDFAEGRGTLLSLFELEDRARPRLLEQLALSGDFTYGAIVGSVAHLVTDDTASNRIGLRFEPSPPAAGALAVRRAMAELHAANSLAIAEATPTARLPGISRRTRSGELAPFEPTCSAYTVTHGAELQSILSFDLETGSLARTLLEAPFGSAELVGGELALEPPRPANPNRGSPTRSYRFSLSSGPATLASSTPSPPAPSPVLEGVGVGAAIPLDPNHTLALRCEPTSLTVAGASVTDSRVLIRVLGSEASGAASPVPEASVVPPSDPANWSAQSYSFGYFPEQRLLAIASDPYVATTNIARQSPSVLHLFAISSRNVAPLAVIRHVPFALSRTQEARPEHVFLERGLLFDVTEEALYVWNPARPTVTATRVPLTRAP